MNITLFGGSFNPPHLGHALIIQEFLASGLTDEVWILPNNIHSFGKDLAPSYHRLAMCALLMNFLKLKSHILNIKLCSIEIDLNLSGKTIDTLSSLQTNYQYLLDKLLITTNLSLDQEIEHQILDIKYSFLMGSDQLPKFHLWDNYQDLLDQMVFWVYPRDGYPMEPLLPGMKPFIQDNQTITNLSSTLVRNRLSKKQDVSLVLPEKILGYIQANKIY